MPKHVNHQERRMSIARALWSVVDQYGWSRATLREVAREAGISLGQLQHYFSSRSEMLAFAIDFSAEQSEQRIEQAIAELSQPPHPRDVLRIVLVDRLPLQPDARATSRMNAAYMLEATQDQALQELIKAGLRSGREKVERLIRQAIDDGQISPDRDAMVETDLVLSLSGLAPLVELGVIEPHEALRAIDQHLAQLFTSLPSPD